jgi:hypothetical protein
MNPRGDAMDKELLVEQKDDGQRLVTELLRSGFDVTAAFWVRASEDGSWTLYISSKDVSSKKDPGPYRRVYDAISRANLRWVSPADVSVIHASDPPSVAAVMALNRHPGKSGINYNGRRLGSMAVEGVYIYPRQRWFKGFDEIKQQFPSAEIIALLILGKDIGNPALRELAGHINAAEFEGRKPTTMYFMGAQGSSGKALAEMVFIYRPEGWNTLYRADTNSWEEVAHAKTGKALYDSADFSPLAALKADQKPGAWELEMIKKRMAEGGYSLTTPFDPTPITGIPYTPPSRPGERTPPPIDWETLREIMEAGGVITVTKTAQPANA